jgi:hypothetical protein
VTRVAPKVTVLMAVHNGGADLARAVDSVLAQTFRDFELLVVDDGSTDGSAATIESYGDDRVRLLRNDGNIGQVPSLNRGLAKARGEYVARLDHDDLCLPSRLERQVAVLEAERAVALVGTWLDVYDESDRLYAKLRGRISDFVEFVFAILVDEYPFGHPSLMYRREVVEALGGYDASLAPSEDKDLYRRLALERHDARVVPEPLVHYRRHEGQLSQLQRDTQLANDHLSQERFIGRLAPAAPVRALRLLLAGRPEAWDEDADLVKALDTLLVGAADALRLTGAETDKLARLVAARAVRVASDAWRAGARAQWRASPRLAGYGATRGGARRTPAYAAAYVLGPAAGALLRPLRHTAASPRLSAVRHRARTSRFLRTLYAWMPHAPGRR